MFHDSRYESECPEHGWYINDDGCAVDGCENSPASGPSTVSRTPAQASVTDLANSGSRPASDASALGGVPEQGLPLSMDQIEAAAREEHACASGAPWEGLSQGVRDMYYRTAERIVRAALERPRPALPAPEPPDMSGLRSTLEEILAIATECGPYSAIL